MVVVMSGPGEALTGTTSDETCNKLHFKDAHVKVS